jgi:hypothetical protein
MEEKATNHRNFKEPLSPIHTHTHTHTRTHRHSRYITGLQGINTIEEGRTGILLLQGR